MDIKKVISFLSYIIHIKICMYTIIHVLYNVHLYKVQCIMYMIINKSNEKNALVGFLKKVKPLRGKFIHKQFLDSLI